MLIESFDFSEEMKNFARQWMDPVFQFTSLLFVATVHVSLLVGVILGLALRSWIIGLSVGVSLVFAIYAFLVLVWYANQRWVIIYLFERFKLRS